MKKFNTTGLCNPAQHYMVDISKRVLDIVKMVEEGKYFTINRARQYGKTTTLNELRKKLNDKYSVISLDFQGIGADGFRDEAAFVAAFCRLILREERFGTEIPPKIAGKLEDFVSRKQNKARLTELFDLFIEWFDCSDRALVLMIDEVDSASNNQVFLDFLAQLRESYMNREARGLKAFQSVILAGVTDVKHLKSKIRDDELHKVNSPWNIAADFTIDMRLSSNGIRGMLDEYEAEHHTGMDTSRTSVLIYDYTGGYPFLVSRICQIMDEQLVPAVFSDLSKTWTDMGIGEAVKKLLAEKNTLFESLTGKLVNYPKLKDALRNLLMEGNPITYNAMQESISQMEMYGFIVNQDNKVAVSNRIFETLLYNLFLSDEELNDNRLSKEGASDRNIFVEGGKLNVQLILERFVVTYHQIFGSLEDKFKEKDGRELFLLYLKPIINGTGNYYIEAQTRDQKRTDVIIDYLGKQYIIELKIWHGERYNEAGERQICDYLDYYGLSTGYMLSFNFNKEKETGVKEVLVNGKTLIEAVL